MHEPGNTCCTFPEENIQLYRSYQRTYSLKKKKGSHFVKSADSMQLHTFSTEEANRNV